MTWEEACHKDRARWLMWIVICSFSACGFLIKKATLSELLWFLVIGVTNGTAVGFAVGPAAEKSASIISGLFAGTPFYFIGISILVVGLSEAESQHRSFVSDVIPIALILLIVGIIFSNRAVCQSFSVTRQVGAVGLRKT